MSTVDRYEEEWFIVKTHTGDANHSVQKLIDPLVCILINKVHYIHGQICATDDHAVSYTHLTLPTICSV